MKISRIILGLLFAFPVFAGPSLAAEANPEPSIALTNAIATLNREASMDAGGLSLIAELIRNEYGADEEELVWAVKHSLSWGEIAALAYLQATIGKSFAEMTEENARQDFWAYAENSGMNCEKMAHSLANFVKRAEKERNTRIFDRLRASRRVHPLPDVGNGFGLFQEALDFRRLDESSRPTKVHEGGGILAKGEK